MKNLATSQERITRIWRDASKPKQQRSYGEYSWKPLILKVPTRKQEGAEGTCCKETHAGCLCMAWLWSGSHYHPKDKLKSLLPKMVPNYPCDPRREDGPLPIGLCDQHSSIFLKVHSPRMFLNSCLLGMRLKECIHQGPWKSNLYF